VIKPYYEDEWVKIFNCDCREGMKELPSGSVDLVLTDPPWMISQEIIIHRSLSPTKYKYVGKDISLDMGSWDHFESEAEYWEFIDQWIEECARVMREGAHLVTFFDVKRISDLVRVAEKYKLMWRQMLAWLKTNPVPRARMVDFMVALEHAPWFTKGTKSRKAATFNYQLGQRQNVVESAIPGHTNEEDGNRDHSTQKPLKVLKTWICYLSNPGDVILDPFCGSGTTLQSAKKLNRRAVGFEINEGYCEVSANRCRQMVFNLEGVE